MSYNKNESGINLGGINGIGHRKWTKEEFEEVKAFIDEAAKNETPEEKRSKITFGWRTKMYDHMVSEVDERIEIGHYLVQLLTDLKIKKGVFANYVGLKPPNLSALISGKRRLNVDLAMKFAAIFEIEAKIWLNIQTKNELLQIKDNILEKDYKLSDLINA